MTQNYILIVICILETVETHLYLEKHHIPSQAFKKQL